MSWLDKLKPPGFSQSPERKQGIPDGLWEKCPACQEVLFSEDLKKNNRVCMNCDHHFKLSSKARLDLILEPDSFVEYDAGLKPKDPLKFKDLKKYSDRIKAIEKSKKDIAEAFVYGEGKIFDLNVVLGSFVFEYMGGSMGSVVGEKLTRCLELALKQKKPCLVITSSGGARMQEGILSLMQMAKSSAAVKRLKQNGIPLIILLTDPTTGGVAASIAMLGDVLLGEPNALIGFAGPRVIEQTIKQSLPEGFQRSEFLLEHGMLDRIVSRKNLKMELFQIFSMLSGGIESKGA